MLNAVTFAPRCPTCHEPVVWEGNPSRPFCTERCRLVDLGAWMTERYRVPGEDAHVPDDDDENEPDGSDESGEE
jgi:endogenous inhibitor of DNA gyrase (YacG/DUF329 family)